MEPRRPTIMTAPRRQVLRPRVAPATQIRLMEDAEMKRRRRMARNALAVAKGGMIAL